MISVANILNAISKEKALILFKTAALGKVDGNILGSIVRSKTKLTSKQYYSRMSALLKSLR
jgi:hypothetical protein